VSASNDFLTQLEKELAKGGDKKVLMERAWLWFDSQHFTPQEETVVRKQMEKLLDYRPPKAILKPRFTHLLDSKLYPTKGWLAKYVDYTTFCDAPLPFHFFVGAVMLGAALKREAWIPFGRSPTYGSMYVVLVAPPGCCYKSTATRIGAGLLKEAELTRLVSGRATPEGLSNILSYAQGEDKREAIALIVATELYRFLAGHNTPANNQIVSALTSWYDAEDEDDDVTVTRSERKLSNIAISLIGCSTLEWLVESLPKNVFAGGFMSRLVFVVQEHTDRVNAMSPPDDPLKRIELIEDLKEISESFRGPKELTKQAREYYDSWFLDHYRYLANSDERTADFYQRRADYVRKFSLVLAASECREFVELVDVEQAVKVLNALNPALDSIITPMSLGEGGRDLDIVRRTLEKYQEMAHSELVRKCCARGISADELARAISTLKAADMVEEHRSGKRGGKFYRYTK